MPKVVVTSLLAPTLLGAAECSNLGKAESFVEDGGNPDVLFGLGSARTFEPVVELSVDDGWRKLNLGVVVVWKEFELAPKILFVPNEVVELDGVPKTLWEVLVPFPKGVVELVLEVVGRLNEFVGGANVVGAPKGFLAGKLNGEEKGLGLSCDPVDMLVVVLALFVGSSSSELSVMKSEVPDSRGDRDSSLLDSSTIPQAAASDAVRPLMTAGRVRPRRLLSTKVREKTCFRRDTESIMIVESMDQTLQLKSEAIPHLIEPFRKGKPNSRTTAHPLFLQWKSHVLHRSFVPALLHRNLELLLGHPMSNLPSSLTLRACTLSISTLMPFFVRG